MKRKTIGLVAGILIALCAPSVSLAYDAATVFCVSDFGNADINGTYTYGSPLWDGRATWHNGTNGYLSGSDINFSSWTVLVYPTPPPSGTFTDAQAYLSTTAGGLSGWGLDSGNGATSPAGTVSVGACAGDPEPTATSSEYVIPISSAPQWLSSIALFVFFSSLFFLLGLISSTWILLRFFK